MSDRITRGHLQAAVDRINRIMNRPAQYMAEDGKTNIGHFHLSQAYGGYCLCVTTNEMGAEGHVVSMGHIPARDLLNRMQAFISGIEYGKELGK